MTALPGVITVMENGGQFQVVVGNNVSKVYAGLPTSLTDGDRVADPSAGSGQKVSALSRVIDVISSIFAPILGVLAATGILKGLLIILSTTHVLASSSTTCQIPAVLAQAGAALGVTLRLREKKTKALGFSGSRPGSPRSSASPNRRSTASPCRASAPSSSPRSPARSPAPWWAPAV
ncbi:hypothetical protein [Microbacterium dextranolyticum]|uniref:Uncharacterized protein n=1 Tax=Microbacterium dextranolyticum TaxID=36806 RepID=A0A9W6HKZ0_9MICO|nr:hypothetical protein [Microbacterium dextranolyticum]MBM7464026.1 hypothetical protein [Microbacterium dextranolyticum]GLJ95107.1 hypothetical protein GCM10017591_11690 [Microbacterium dextranolyticum]